jgi:hypothetical protein
MEREPPTLDQLAHDPRLFDALPPAAQGALFEQVEVLAARLRARMLTHRTNQAEPREIAPDRAVLFEEALHHLGMHKDYLYRHWRKLGGYKDVDGHIKFTMSAIQRYLKGQAWTNRAHR